MNERRILYFEKAGSQNTQETLKRAKERALELRIKTIVVASTTGETGLKALEEFKNTDMRIIVVGHAGGAEYTEEAKRKIGEKGGTLLFAPHTLSWGVGDALRGKYQGFDVNRAVAEAFRRFCEGMKVCIEIAMMVTDAGLVKPGEEIVSIAGTGRGADTAIVLKTAYTRKFLDLKVREIIVMPRE
ncbi:hypothetical protein B6U74_01160 [Candidatus Bathyarchaeota archaeon ex4484_205]|nr:MAG: hypothetical protein B6U74_01160 [Candidatus Bathyarchaeota archaeon ex4484_205]